MLPEVAASGVTVSRGVCTPVAFAANVGDSMHKDDDPDVTTVTELTATTGSTRIGLDTTSQASALGDDAMTEVREIEAGT